MKAFVPRIAVLLSACMLSHGSYAESPSSNAVVVTSTRIEDVTTRLPAPIAILTADDIRHSPAQTLPEMLALQAGVSTRSLYGNHAARATVDLRGFGATATQNTLILLDGRRLNDVDLAAVDFAAIPLASIARIEIIRGSGSVLYGDSAVGGVINIITKQPGHGGTSGNATATGGSYNTRQLDASLSHGQGPIAFNTFISGIRSDGYHRNNNLKQNNFQADLRLAKDQGEWFFKFGVDEQDLRLPGVRVVNPGAGVDELQNDRRGTNTPNDYADQNGYFLTGGYSQFLSGKHELVVDAGYRKKNQKAFFDDYAFSGAYANYLNTDLGTWSLTPRLKIKQALFGGPGTSTVGVDYYQSQYDSDRALNPSTAGTPVHRLDVHQSSLAAYAHNISEITGNSTLTLGARLQQIRLRANDTFDAAAPGGAFASGAPGRQTSNNQHMLELGLRRRLSPWWSVFGKIERSARFATVDEIFQATSQTNYLQDFSPLKPQTAKTWDLGADYASGDFKFSADIYRMYLNDEIHFNIVSYANENLDPTRRDGFTVSASQGFAGKWRLTGDYAHTRSLFRGGAFAGNEVPLVARNTGSLSLLWSPNRDLAFSTSARYTGTKRFDNDQSNTFQKIPAYRTVDLKLLGTVDTWKWQAGINNVFNEKAYDTGVRSTSTPDKYNAYPLPERNLSLAIGKDF